MSKSINDSRKMSKSPKSHANSKKYAEKKIKQSMIVPKVTETVECDKFRPINILPHVEIFKRYVSMIK